MLTEMSRDARRDYLLLSVAAAMNSACLAMFFQLPRFAKSIGEPEDVIGYLLGVSLFPVVLCSPLAGQLIQRIRLRGILYFGIVVFSVGTAAHGMLAYGTAQLFAARIVQGLGYTFVFTPCFAAVAQLVPDRSKSRGIAYFVFSLQIGNVLGSFLGSVLMEHRSFAMLVAASTAVSLACLLPAAFVKFSPAPAVPAGAGAQRQGSVGGILASRDLGIGIGIVVLLGSVYGTLLQFMPTYLDALLAAGRLAAPVSSSVFLSCALACIALSRVALGQLGDGPRKHAVMATCYLGVAAALGLVIAIDGTVLTLLSALVFGFSYGILYPALNALLMLRAPAGLRPRVTGTLAAAFQVGYMGFAFVAGKSIALLGYAGMFQLLIGLLVLMGVLFVAFERERVVWLPRPWASGKRG